MELTGEIKSYSQSQQDLFVLSCFEDSYKGFFVDIGAGYNEAEDGCINSNTLLLEQKGWTGLALDVSMSRLKDRKCVTHAEVIGNPRSISEILKSLNCPKVIDYLSIDLDGLDYKVLKDFIDAEYEFKVLTYEHDLYSGKKEAEASKYDAFFLLAEKGYVRFVENVGTTSSLNNLLSGCAYEDWYINPKYINYKYINCRNTPEKLK